MVRLLLIFCVAFAFLGCKPEAVDFDRSDDTTYIPPTGSGDGTIQGPIVNFTEKPLSHWIDESTHARFEVIPGDHEIEQLDCAVDAVLVPCSLIDLYIPLTGYGLGDHEVIVEVVDKLGLVGRAKAPWYVTDQFFPASQRVNVQGGGKRADILFVVDNSDSMREEQRELASKISNLFDMIGGLNWRVGIITTDPYSENPNTGFPNLLGDGSLLRFPSRNFWIDSNMPLETARTHFSQTIIRPEVGSGHERGIRNTYRAIERSLRPQDGIDSVRLNQFFRDLASLSVVVISDENETTHSSGGLPMEDLYRSEPDNLVELVKNSWGTQKKFQFNSVVVKPGDTSCLGTQERFGEIYAQLSNLTGGDVEDICASDYSGALRRIGTGIVQLQKKFRLRCRPADTDDDGTPDLSIQQTQGTATIPSFQIQGDIIEFATALEEGSYQFRYNCLTPVPN